MSEPWLSSPPGPQGARAKSVFVHHNIASVEALAEVSHGSIKPRFLEGPAHRIDAQQHNSGNGMAVADRQLAEVLVLGQKNTTLLMGRCEDLGVGQAAAFFGQVVDVVAP